MVGRSLQVQATSATASTQVNPSRRLPGMVIPQRMPLPPVVRMQCEMRIVLHVRARCLECARFFSMNALVSS